MEFTSGILSTGQPYSIEEIKYRHIVSAQIKAMVQEIPQAELSIYIPILVACSILKIENKEVTFDEMMDLDFSDASMIMDIINVQLNKIILQ